jgi:hypothetical protein
MGWTDDDGSMGWGIVATKYGEQHSVANGEGKWMSCRFKFICLPKSAEHWSLL